MDSASWRMASQRVFQTEAASNAIPRDRTEVQ
jgi:hypothetical protein